MTYDRHYAEESREENDEKALQDCREYCGQKTWELVLIECGRVVQLDSAQAFSELNMALAFVGNFGLSRSRDWKGVLFGELSEMDGRWSCRDCNGCKRLAIGKGREMNDIQEIGLMLMILPPLLMVPILAFGIWQLAMARRVGKAAKARLRVD